MVADTVLALRGVAVGYGGRAVLSGVSLDVDAGEVVALVGGNGSGKTTLLRCLAGLAPPLRGAVSWCGRPLPVGPRRVGIMGVVFQAESPAPFSVRELVCLGLGLDGPPGPAARARVDDALADLDLSADADRPCAELSGGQWRLALLARALVSRPALLVLDEPTNHLDPRHRAELLARLDAWRGRVAVVVATHDLDFALRCDRVAVLARGGVVADDTPAHALAPPVLVHALGVRARMATDGDGAPLLQILGPAETKESRLAPRELGGDL